MMCVLVCQWWRLAVRTVSALWCSKPPGLGGSGLGDRVVFWFDFGQGVNKSGEEALVTYRPADNISGSGDLCCQAKLFLRHTHTHTHAHTHRNSTVAHLLLYTFTLIAVVMIG